MQYKQSIAWVHFEQEIDSLNVSCKICNQVLIRGDKSTKGLWSHLMHKHQNEYLLLRISQSGVQNQVVSNIPKQERNDESTIDVVNIDGPINNSLSQSTSQISKKNREKYCHAGYSYIRDGQNSTGEKMFWRCDRNRSIGCKGRVHTAADAERTFLSLVTPHDEYCNGDNILIIGDHKNIIRVRTKIPTQKRKQSLKENDLQTKRLKSEGNLINVKSEWEHSTFDDFEQQCSTTTIGTLMQQIQQTEMEPMNAHLFVELMAQFFGQGWMLGSSGGMAAITQSLGNGEDGGDCLLLVSPSSVPKERLTEQDLFAFDLKCIQERCDDICLSTNPIFGPTHLRPSACTPLFLLLLQSTPGTSCVIHTHSKYANLVTVLFAQRNCLEITNQEMLKGVMDRRNWRSFQNTDKFILPIVENKPQEQDLLPILKEAIDKYPHSPAFLVRRHGLFVLGPSWQKTKVMLECLEYLLELIWEMGKAGIDDI
ncbi:unnamed protein product [Meloidogyne enterolobii]|uniref:Uncharacterized protein n=1 Tax=Meloidogyne enterolobii TaxID=390850 RepID=A0ACB0XZ27_MELEN